MAITLEELADGIRDALRRGPVDDAASDLCALVGRALANPAFVERHLPDRAEGAPPRAGRFEDPELGFCICGHVYADAATSAPHDHGSSWAIYGQAAGTTEMTDWKIVSDGGDGRPKSVETVTTYTLAPGDAHFYGIGAVHSPERVGPTRLLRIEGANLDHVRRSDIEPS